MSEPALTCIHAEKGLCPACQADYDTDPDAYDEFGDHPRGIANWKSLQEEIAVEADRVSKLPPVIPDPNIPF